MALILAAAPMRAMRAPVSSVSMSATEYAKTLPGAGPFGFFDPLKLLEIDKDMTEGALCSAHARVVLVPRPFAVRLGASIENRSI